MAKKLKSANKDITGGITKEELKQQIEEMRDRVPQERQPSDIITKEPFVNVFELSDSGYEGILQSMTDKGYDWKFPIITMKGENGDLICLDGHRRLTAAKSLELPLVPVHVVEPPAEADDVTAWALSYMYALQFNRRNVDDKTLLRFVTNIDWKAVAHIPGKKKAKLAKLTGYSETKCQRALTVATATPWAVEQVLEHGESINAVYNQLKEEEEEERLHNQDEESQLSMLTGAEPWGGQEEEAAEEETTLPEERPQKSDSKPKAKPKAPKVEKGPSAPGPEEEPEEIGVFTTEEEEKVITLEEEEEDLPEKDTEEEEEYNIEEDDFLVSLTEEEVESEDGGNTLKADVVCNFIKDLFITEKLPEECVKAAAKLVRELRNAGRISDITTMATLEVIEKRE